MKRLKNNNLIASVRALFSFETGFYQLQYRVPMRIEEAMIFKNSCGQTCYYVCPRCGITVEREFISFCSRCGQCLDWSDCENAAIIYPKKP